MRIGSVRKLLYWTFLQTLSAWYFMKGRSTQYLQNRRGLRQFSHHSRVNDFLRIRAQRMRDRIALGPPEVRQTREMQKKTHAYIYIMCYWCMLAFYS